MVGRIKEIQQLQQLLQDNRSHFVAVYGRRRIGKTFLIRELFKNDFTFYVTGMANASLKLQLSNFNLSLRKLKAFDETNPIATDWLTAFHQLATPLEKSKQRKKIIFIDELPWMDTPRSNFLSAFEHFWNSWASARNDIFLVVCGSSASWMINKLINNKGGLHNRIAARIKLNPFTLKETAEFLKTKKVNYTQYQMVQLYMAFGGVPYYLEQIDCKKSALQNINNLCFGEDAVFKTEYQLLFKSLFKNAEQHIQIVKAISSANQGISRNEIIKQTNFTNGGGLTSVLNELIESNFIRQYVKTGQKKRDSLYQLVDNFVLFYHKFMVNTKLQGNNAWLNIINTPQYYAWAGNAFEMVCLQHINQIKTALGIQGVQTQISTWRNEIAQIDLVIDRKDDVINLLEIKFSESQFTIDKHYEANLRNKRSAFMQDVKTKKALWIIILTTFGLVDNKYSHIAQHSFTMDILFNS